MGYSTQDKLIFLDLRVTLTRHSIIPDFRNYGRTRQEENSDLKDMSMVLISHVYMPRISCENYDRSMIKYRNKTLTVDLQLLGILCCSVLYISMHETKENRRS